jgi:hypothetical protein
MSAEHNHAPKCCCGEYQPAVLTTCPACPEHGALACTCGSTYATYEGPERDCPTHGECACDLARSEPLDHKAGPHHEAFCPRFVATPYTEQETTK